MTYVQDLQPNTYILLFVLFGMIWAGLALLALAVYIGIQRIVTPKPPALDERRWTRDWESIERDISGEGQ
jgi:hypothetical protein